MIEIRRVLPALLIVMISMSLPIGFAKVQNVTVISVCFSPGGNCGAIVAYWISRANSTIHIEIYSFTLNQTSDALVNAFRANPKLSIEIVWDDGMAHEKGSQYNALLAAGISIHLDKRPGTMHDKVAIIDDHIVLTGSFNWSNEANAVNRENLIVIDSMTVAALYEGNFQQNYAATA